MTILVVSFRGQQHIGYINNGYITNLQPLTVAVREQ